MAEPFLSAAVRVGIGAGAGARHVVITGASSGVGASVAKRMAAQARIQGRPLHLYLCGRKEDNLLEVLILSSTYHSKSKNDGLSFVEKPRGNSGDSLDIGESAEVLGVLSQHPELVVAANCKHPSGQ